MQERNLLTTHYRLLSLHRIIQKCNLPGKKINNRNLREQKSSKPKTIFPHAHTHYATRKYSPHVVLNWPRNLIPPQIAKDR